MTFTRERIMMTGPDDTNRLDPAVAGLAVLGGVHCFAASRLPVALAGSAAHLAVALGMVTFSDFTIGGGWMKHHEARV